MAAPWEKYQSQAEPPASGPPDMSGQYNTQLNPREERQFSAWATTNNRLRDTYDYDMRGAWKDMQSGAGKQGDNGHFSDKYKKPNHPTFSDQSIYNTAEMQGGKWSQDAQGRDVFVPSRANLKNMPAEQMQKYFAKVEPNVTLQLPQSAAPAGPWQKYAPEPKAAPEGNMLDAVIEPAKAIGSNIARQAVSGLAGLGQFVGPGDAGVAPAMLMEPGDPSQAGSTVRNVQAALPQSAPQTQAGQEGLEALGNAAQFMNPAPGLAGLGNLAVTQDPAQAAQMVRDVQSKGAGQMLGDAAFEATGSPLAATAAMMVPDAAAGVAGPAIAKQIGSAAKAGKEAISNMPILRRAPVGLIEKSTNYPTPAFAKALKSQGMTYENIIDEIPRLPDNMPPQKAAQEIVKRKLLARDTDDFLASKKLDDAGNVVDDDLGKEALRQGFRPGDVQAVKVATEGTKAKMRDMLKIRRQTYANERAGLDVRPSDVIGDSVLNRFSHIRNTANKAVLDLNRIAADRLGGRPINADAVAKNFYDELAKIDVDVDMSTGIPRPNFQGSMIAKDRTSQRVIKDVIDLLAEPKAADALRAHKLKRQLDAMIDFRKKNEGGLTESGRNIAKSVRASLNNVIRDVDPEYAAVNDTLSASLGAMNDFERILGPSIDIWDAGAQKAIGQDLRGLMSNRKSRVKLENAVNNIDSVARELGGQFDDNVGDLVLFAKTLDDQFGASARSSLAGELDASGERLARRAASGDVRGMGVDLAVKKGMEQVNKMRDINDPAAFRALDRLLGKAKPKPPSTQLQTIP